MESQRDSLLIELQMEQRLSDQRQAYIDRFYNDRVSPLLQRRAQARIATQGRVSTVGQPLTIEPGTLPGQSGSSHSLRVQHLYTDSLHEYLLPQVVLFAAGSDQLSEGAQDSLLRLAQFLGHTQSYTFIIEGHTDNEESAALDGDSWTLSQNRALQVARFLIGAGISPAVIQISARGKYAPRASNASAADKALNRRVDLYLSPLSRYP